QAIASSFGVLQQLADYGCGRSEQLAIGFGPRSPIGGVDLEHTHNLLINLHGRPKIRRDAAFASFSGKDASRVRGCVFKSKHLTALNYTARESLSNRQR